MKIIFKIVMGCIILLLSYLGFVRFSILREISNAKQEYFISPEYKIFMDSLKKVYEDKMAPIIPKQKINKQKMELCEEKKEKYLFLISKAIPIEDTVVYNSYNDSLNLIDTIIYNLNVEGGMLFVEKLENFADFNNKLIDYNAPKGLQNKLDKSDKDFKLVILSLALIVMISFSISRLRSRRI